MDSLTQFVLGATVGMATLGPRTGLRKAALLGGVLGSLPDVDVFWPYDTDIDAFVLHRSVTHALPVFALATPLLAEALRRFVSPLREARARVWLAVFLCLATHALLDAMTIYGTRLFWPLWPEPVGLGSIFIIDPLYTLPLLALTLWALFVKGWRPAHRRAVVVALALSTAYLGWSAAMQRVVHARAERILAGMAAPTDQVIASPTPFNTLFWRVIAMDKRRYFDLYIPLLGDDDTITVYVYPRLDIAAACLTDNAHATTLAAFTGGFYAVFTEGSEVMLADLRMGLPPDFVFQFAVAERDVGAAPPFAPRRIARRPDFARNVDWLLAGIMGERAVRGTEATRLATFGGEAGRAAVERAC